MGKRSEVDVVLDERLHVFAQAEMAQPILNSLHDALNPHYPAETNTNSVAQHHFGNCRLSRVATHTVAHLAWFKLPEMLISLGSLWSIRRRVRAFDPQLGRFHFWLLGRLQWTKSELRLWQIELRGTLISRDHVDYEEVRELYNGMIDKRPLLIARCKTPPMSSLP